MLTPILNVMVPESKENRDEFLRKGIKNIILLTSHISVLSCITKAPEIGLLENSCTFVEYYCFSKIQSGFHFLVANVSEAPSDEKHSNQ